MRSRAASFLREQSRTLVPAVARAMRIDPYSVEQVLRMLIERSERLGLFRARQPARRAALFALDARATHRAVLPGRDSAPAAMKRLRTLVVVHASLVPPETLEGYSDKQIEEWRTEYDVITTLRARGHEVRCLGVLDSLTELRSTIAEWQPDIVFNLLEEFDGIVTYDQHVVAFLELMRQPYTGCNPRGLLLSRDKSLSKQLLAFHRIATPQFAVFRRGARFHVPRKLRFPLFVKSTVEDASLGIAQASVVEDAAQPEGAHRVRARAGEVRRAGRGVHRGARAVRRGARQRAPDAPAGVGDGVRLAARTPSPRSPRAR